MEKSDRLVNLESKALASTVMAIRLSGIGHVDYGTPSMPSPAAASGVQVLNTTHYRAAAACLAEAFAVDDVADYFISCPDTVHWTAEQKWQQHLRILEYVVYAHCLKGLVLGIPSSSCSSVPQAEATVDQQQEFDAIALFMPPGANMDDWPTILRSGMWRLHWQLSREGGTRFFQEFLPLLHHTKHEVLVERDPHAWYLVYIGTRKAARGKGCARRLIAVVADVADSEQRAIYLESSNEVNLIIYGKLGFELKRKISLLRGEHPIELDIMLREPRSST